ncbi:MAG: HPF/RaiA family ribosome-associated protein [Terriglobales bacterium]|jgi:DNA-directed RNA polymerase specialized sigma24 family protein/ribosome-associated translation inhibitor RaiA
MNVHVSYKIPKTHDVEKEIAHQIEKLTKRLQVFRPELIHLKVVLEQSSAREGTEVGLNLRLPSGQLAASEKAGSAAAAIKSAFDDLMQQVNRHKELLRSSHRWRRWRGGAPETRELGVPFEQTLAAVQAPTISADDIGSYVNANLARLERFVDRELYFRQSEEEQPDNGLVASEVVNEVIARALGDADRPEKLALEPWLYRLGLEAINEMMARLHELKSPVRLEGSRRKQNVQASDEAALQFHQADEDWTREGAIADRRVANPEQTAYADEMVALVQVALEGVDRTDREAFLLFGIEGFSVDEIASITGRHAEAVGESIQRARECVRNAPSVAREFRRVPFVVARKSAAK